LDPSNVEPEADPPPPLLKVSALATLPAWPLMLPSLKTTVLIAPLICQKAPAVVLHRSPLTGAVGAVPCGTLIPAPADAEAAISSLPVRVPPPSGSALSPYATLFRSLDPSNVEPEAAPAL